MSGRNSLEISNKNYRSDIGNLMQVPFMLDLGVTLVDCGPGWCSSQLIIEARHGQQDGLVHAGVQTAMADHTAGAAAYSLIAPVDRILSVAFQVNMLRPCSGQSLFCEATVLKPGRRFHIVEASIYSLSDQVRTLTQRATFTMAVIPGPTETA